MLLFKIFSVCVMVNRMLFCSLNLVRGFFEVIVILYEINDRLMMIKLDYILKYFSVECV